MAATERQEEGSKRTGDVSGKEVELFRLVSESFGEAMERKRPIPDEVEFLVGCNREEVGCEQIGVEDGFVNYIYRLRSLQSLRAQHSVVVKWARPVARMADGLVPEPADATSGEEKEEGMLTLERNSEEWRALTRMALIVPGATPALYWHDHHRHFFLMEDLRHHVTLRSVLDTGRGDLPGVLAHIGGMLARLHSRTHINVLGADQWRKLVDDVVEPKRRGLHQLADIFFDTMFKRDSQQLRQPTYSDSMQRLLPEVMDNAEADAVLALLKTSFVDGHQVCLLHNDTHPGSFMVSRDGSDIRMLDLEAVWVGNPGKELGYALGEVVMFYYVHRGRGHPGTCDDIRGGVRRMLREYVAAMGDLLPDHAHFARYLAGHAAHFGLYRTLGRLHPFPQFAHHPHAESQCFAVLTKLLKDMQDIDTLEKFEKIAFL